ncbi:hypothetical protein EVA_12716 [gut metagenome]|uniref:Uncharacterized protein n=1 Tax=gut metagenome TaxID=749906 RepID=J9FXB7_9ZZZZ
MGQPHFLNPCFLCKSGSLSKGHMFISLCLLFFILFTIHTFTDKQI